MASEVVTKRLHIGGMIPSITQDHLRDRFQSFGQVKAVEQLAPDALGQPRRFAYLTIDITPLQLKKCLNIMSGSMWRGTQLRIAEAKPKYEDRVEKERNPTREEYESRVRKKQRRNAKVNLVLRVGKEAQDMRLVTEENYERKKFWSLSEGHLIRPLAMRPTHPLPPLATSSSASSSNPRPPPARLRRRVIDPRKWTHTNANESTLNEGTVEQGQGEWEWEEEEEEQVDEQGQFVIGYWKRIVDGEAVEEQVVRGKRRRMDLDEEQEFDLEGSDSGSELFGSRPGEDRASSPLFGGRHEAGEKERSASPLFAGRPAVAVDPEEEDVASKSESDDGEEAEFAQKGSEPADESSTSREASPLFASDSSQTVGRGGRNASPLFESHPEPAPKKTASAPRPKPQPKTVDIPDPLRQQVLSENCRDKGLLASLLGGLGGISTAEEDDLEVEGDAGRSGWRGFADSDSEEEWATLRLRGGAPDEDQSMSDSSDDDEESESGSDSDSSESDSDSSGSSRGSNSEDEESSEDEKAGPVAAPAVATALPAPGKTSLKDLFAPAKAGSLFGGTGGGGGFSLLASLDPTLEVEELDVPLAPSLRKDADELAPLEPLPPSSNVAGLFDADPDISLFFPPVLAAQVPGASAGGVAPQAKARGKDAYTEDMEGEGWRGFWRLGEETDETMRDIWGKEKLELTREWKRRHREAKKHRRRRGGVDEVE